MREVCVYCGSSTGGPPAYSEAARRLGNVLVERGIGLVYGGGDVGLMGVIADTVLEAGGKVTGVIPRRLVEREVAHLGLTRMVVVDSMHERKAQMADMADGFMALPGGLGTLDELFEVWTWGQLGIHQKPIGLLDVNGFFQPLLGYLDHAVTEGFVRPQHRALVCVHQDPAALLDAMAAWQPTHVDKWHRPPAP